METAYDGRQVVGIDLHRRRSVLVRMTEDGRRLGMARITNSPQELCREIARAGTSPRVVLEATFGWYWAADTLASAGADVHLAHPLGVKASPTAGSRTMSSMPLILLTCCGWAACPRRGSPRLRFGSSVSSPATGTSWCTLRTSCKDQVHAVLAKLGIPVTCSHILRHRRVSVAGWPAACPSPMPGR